MKNKIIKGGIMVAVLAGVLLPVGCKKDYTDPVYIQHIFQGISYIAGRIKKLDYSKAYADSRDTPLRY